MKKIFLNILIIMFINMFNYSSEESVLKWRLPLSGKIISSPVSYKNDVFVLCDDKKIYSVNQNGEINWTVQLKFKSENIFACAYDGILYTQLSNKKIIAVNTKGKIIFEHIDDALANNIIITNKGHLFLVYQNKIKSFTRTLKERFEYTLESECSANVIADDSSLYLPLKNNKLLILSSDGHYNNEIKLSSIPSNLLLLDKQNILLTTQSDDIYCYNDEGLQIWKLSLNKIKKVLSSKKYIYILLGNNELVKIDYNSKLISSDKFQYNIKSIGLNDEDLIYLYSDDGKILKSDNIKINQIYDIKTDPGEILITSNALMLAGKKNWNLYAFNVEKSKLKSWNQHKGNEYKNNSVSKNIKLKLEDMELSKKDIIQLEKVKMDNYKTNLNLLRNIKKEISLNNNNFNEDFILNLLEYIASGQTFNVDFPKLENMGAVHVLRSQAYDLLGSLGNSYTMEYLKKALKFEPDPYSFSRIISAMAMLRSDPEGLCQGAILELYNRKAIFRENERITEELINAIKIFYDYHGYYTNKNSLEVLINIIKGSYPDSLRQRALDVLENKNKNIGFK